MPESTSGSNYPEPTIGEVQLRHIAEFSAVALTTQGRYDGMAEPFQRLLSWTQAVDVAPTGNLLALFYNRPPFEAAGSYRYSLCLPTSKPEAICAREAISGVASDQPSIGRRALSGDAQTSEDDDPDACPAFDLRGEEVLDVREIPRILVASVFYRGHVDGTPEAYGRAAAWIEARPYTAAGAPREVYLARPGQLGEGIIEAEIQVPVMSRSR
jgi:hypothetical protein